MGGVNRIRYEQTTGTQFSQPSLYLPLSISSRSMPQEPGIIATMADSSKAHIFDLTRVVRSMMVKGPRAVPPNKPAYSFKGHQEEGYALDWSAVTAGQLATGDCSGSIYLWNNSGGGSGGTLASSWRVTKPYTGHEGSVEDLQWSPTESTVFASSSVDRTVRIWDSRGKTGPQITVNAHDHDVNVISWNKNVNYLLASGCDDGSFKVCPLSLSTLTSSLTSCS
jgi:ribosome assembly protein RRB1